MNKLDKNIQIDIIAEIGVNHDGNFEKAIRLIQEAKKCGANTAKFQTLFANQFVKKDTKKVLYQSKTTSSKESHYEMIKSLELSAYDFFRINNFCKKIKINFLSTPYDLESLEILKKIKAPRYKTASTDLVDHILHREIIKTRKPVIISTGASNLDEINNTLNLYKKMNHSKITLLHCVSNYPCSEKNINLKVMNTLKEKFKFPIGYSDHSNSETAAVMSVCFGARIIEKHFTLNKKASGPDHKASADPKEFKRYVEAIRRAEQILGSDIKKVHNEEKSIRKISRKSITLKQNLSKNHILRLQDIIMKRPGTGLVGEKINKVLGKKLKKNFLKDYQLKFENLK
jgi:N,N'-diacetyllegionaminate synthase